MKAAIYLRVSGKRQDEENQLAGCLRLAEVREWQTLPPFREVGSAVKNRPVWHGLLARAHRGEINRVIVWSLDRMGRDMFGILTDWRDLRASGCALVSTREPWLGAGLGEAEDLMMAAIAWAAQFERRRTLDRVHEAHARIRANLAAKGEHVTKAGKTIYGFGRPRALLAREENELIACWNGGSNVSQLAKRFGVARATVRAILGPVKLAESESHK